MKLIETQSKWGNLYKRRYYVDGKLVSESEFDSALDKLMFEHNHASMAAKYEDTPYGFRTVWEC